MQESTTTRAALGRIAQIGDLYDARRDRFLTNKESGISLKEEGSSKDSKAKEYGCKDEDDTSSFGFVIDGGDSDQFEKCAHSVGTVDKCLGVNAFKEPLDEEDVEGGEIKMTRSVRIITTDVISEQFKAFDIEEELSLSMMSGLVSFGGSAAFFNRQKRGEKSPHMSLQCTVNTTRQRVDGIRFMINKDYLDNEEATHIVSGITWGATCNITCYYQANRNEDEEQVKVKLQAELNKLKDAMSVTDYEKVANPHEDGEGTSKFTYHVFCDIKDLEKDCPTTFEGALALATSLLTEVSKKHDGKGAPIKYELTSMSSQRKKLKKSEKRGQMYCPIKEDSIEKCFEALQAIKLYGQYITDLMNDFIQHRDAVASKDFASGSDLLNNFESEAASFKSQLAMSLVHARSGNSSAQLSIYNCLETFLNQHCGSEKLCSIMEKHKCTREKLQLISEFKERGVLLIGEQECKEDILPKNTEMRVYLFNMKFTESYERFEEWQKQKELFSRLVSAHENDNDVQLIVIDCELHPELEQRTCIELYEHGKCLHKDVVMKEALDIEECLIEMNEVEKAELTPNKRVPLEICCPKSFSSICTKKEYQWICKSCREVVEYGIEDDQLYCKCGKANPFESTFRCNDIKHGLSFTKFNFDTLKAALAPLKELKETNIILLGETGVGKSTWINAIANYVSFPTLQDAMDASNMKVCIPSTFSYNAETGESMETSIRPESENEHQEAGQSSTKVPKAYRLYDGKHKITIIDTPGLGDVESSEDERSFENILACLSHYNEIHGICIFLKPNISRITAAFRFYIALLLEKLHNSARDNIVFCFTNARSGFYGPGDTLPTLQKLLKELDAANFQLTSDKLYYFENEVFQSACFINGIQMNKEEVSTYSLSWDKAVSEIDRLFEHILMLKPHSIAHTITLNNVRGIMLTLSTIFAETAKTILKNIDTSDAESEKLKRSDNTASNSQEKQSTKLKRIELSHPRIVCHHADCVNHDKVSLHYRIYFDCFLTTSCQS